MFRLLKKITVQVIVGANVVSLLLMFAVGYSGYVVPDQHPNVANVGLFYPFMLIVNLGFFFFWLFVSKKKLWIPIVGFLACAVPTRHYFPVNLPSTPPDGAIKVLSYNTFNLGHDSLDAEGDNKALKYVRDCDADIACLQETYFSNADYKKKAFDKLLSAYAYRDTVKFGEKDGCTCLASKFPIIRKSKIPVESKSNGIALFWLNVDGDTVLVVNCHLESYRIPTKERDEYTAILDHPEDREQVRREGMKMMSFLVEGVAVRARQVRQLDEFLSRHSHESIILCGDFNDHPLSYTHRLVNSHLTDCFTKTGNGPGISYNRKGFYVRIDYIMCSADWTPFECHVDKKTDASDHYPVVCWLKKHSKP